MSNLSSIKKGTLVAPANPGNKMDHVYVVIDAGDPEEGEYIVKLNSSEDELPIKKTREEFLKDGWWANL